MVVEDDPVVRATLIMLIEAMGEGYACREAADGLAARDILRQQPIDFAFVDINLPSMNGLDLLKEVHETYRDLLVVMITGQPSYEAVLEALRHGASEFLPKPFSLNELRITLEKLKKEKVLREENLALFRQAQEKKILENLNQQLDKRVREQRLLQSLHQDLVDIKQTDDFYPLILKIAQDLTQAEYASFMLLDKEEDRLKLVVDSCNNDTHQIVWDAAYQAVQNQTPVFTRGKVSERLAEQQEDSEVRLGISLPVFIRGELFGVLNIMSHNGKGFDDEDVGLLKLLAERSALTVENLALYESMTSNLYDTLRALVNTLEARDPYSSQHSERVTQLSVWFAGKLGLPQADIDCLRFAGALHDIGKIGIPDAILLKAGKLNPQEREIIRTHPLIGERIVTPLGLLPAERTIILYHHERWDGLGYPYGLAGENIPLLSRILALADTFDALTSNRPYRLRWNTQDALDEIAHCSGTQFDPQMAQDFVSLMTKEYIWEAPAEATPEAARASQATYFAPPFQSLEK